MSDKERLFEDDAEADLRGELHWSQR